MRTRRAEPSIPDPFLDPLDELIERANAEDLGDGDVTTQATVPPEHESTGTIVVREAGIAAGLAAAARFFRHLEPALAFETRIEDGARVEPNAVVARVHGPTRSILAGERAALNLMQRMSGIATATRRMVDAVAEQPATILDTRKTAPGLRALDKWAVRLGGGENHRMGLYDQVLVKENHIAAAGGIDAALEQVRAYLRETDRELLVEIETRTIEEVEAVLEAGGADRILLDNMAALRDDDTLDTSRLARAVDRIGERAQTEASGNVTLDTVAEIARTGVDFISSGAITHSVRALDLSLLLTDAPSPEDTGRR